MTRPSHVLAGLVLAGLAAAVWVSAGRAEPTGAIATTIVPRTIVPTPAPTMATTITSTNEVAPITGAPAPDAGPRAVVEAGLAAWGRFAVSGHLAELEPWFDPEGPQYGLLAAEAPELADAPLGAPAYSVVMSDPVVYSSVSETLVEGRVVFARTGEPSQSWRWRVVLRARDGSWRIWTVEDLAP